MREIYDALEGGASSEEKHRKREWVQAAQKAQVDEDGTEGWKVKVVGWKGLIRHSSYLPLSMA